MIPRFSISPPASGAAISLQAYPTVCTGDGFTLSLDFGVRPLVITVYGWTYILTLLSLH
jgi:hypothetical protein